MSNRFALAKNWRGIACLLVSLAAVSLGYRYGYVSWTQRMDRLDQQIRDARTRLKNNQKTVAQARPIEEKYQRVEQFLKQRKTKEAVLSGMLSGIEEHALKNSVRVRKMTPHEAKGGGAFPSLTLSISVEGRMAEIVKFIHSLQESAFAYSVREAHFTGNSPRRSNLLCRLVLNSIGEFVFTEQERLFSQAVIPGSLDREIFSAPQAKKSKTSSVSDDSISGDLEFIKNNFQLRGIMIDENPVAIIEDIKNHQTVFLSKSGKIKGAVLKEISADGIVFEHSGSVLEMTPFREKSKKGYKDEK